ncbi:MAG: zinc ribbon domain-containing protein [Geobacteraceae bacterium]|nr:zinc ribbon domain-containing protein [Geobacteraceae bacterium]
MKPIKEKSLPLAIGLNFVLPGIGYIYMGKPVVGIFACLLCVVISISAAILIVPVWLGMNVIMAIDMLILSNKNKKKLLEESTKKCPNCAELIQKEAKVCRFCSTRFDAVSQLHINEGVINRKCVGCNTSIPIGAKKCSMCGAPA